jgi:DNA topoisomerase-1
MNKTTLPENVAGKVTATTRKKLTSSKKATKRKSLAKKPSTGTEAKTLVIVESPAKAHTIEKYLGSKYHVIASMGHLIDLPKSRMGVDVEHDFEPEYLTIRGRASVLKDLMKEAKKSKAIMLASDPDREGEAIAYLIGKYIGEKAPGIPEERITFNEITQTAIREAIKSPRAIDIAKVDAQKARRVLDRLVGYNLSPLLWKKVKSGLSAGRVQSATLKLICDREKEVESFIPEEYWTVEALLKTHRISLKAELFSFGGEKLKITDESSALGIVKALSGAPAVVAEIRESAKVLRPKPPFTTSTLQQTAATRLGFTSKKTMQIAQKLYEGVSMGSQRMGLITYMRTDSTRIAESAISEARAWIEDNHSAQLPAQAQRYETNSKAQDAHEAIRPTKVTLTPEQMLPYLSRDEHRLYSLIWERFVASQMIPATMKVLTAEISIGEGVFRTSASSFTEEGFFKVVKLGADREERTGHTLPLEVGQKLETGKIHALQHFTQGPSRYSDASIIKALEELGIGRPSTYAPTISTLLERYYVTRENRQLAPTILGKTIIDILGEYFGDIIGADFTAKMETTLDDVEDENSDWVAAMKDFYGPFKKRIDEVMEKAGSRRGSLDEATDIVCDLCGKPMVKKLGRFGFFLACTGFPECKNTKSIPLAICPKCGGDIVARKGVKGRVFYGCANYPKCDFVTYDKPTTTICPKCGWFLVEKYDKTSGAHKVCINPACNYLHTKDDEKEGEE